MKSERSLHGHEPLKKRDQQPQPRYRSLSSFLKARFHETVRKITLDAGLGCPNRDGSLSNDGCIYCNPRGSGTGALSQGVSISEQVDRGIAFLAKRYGCRKFMAYFQSFTNTYAAPERLRKLYSEALRRPEVVGMAVGTRPDQAPEGVLDVLEDFAVERLVWVEYGLQSIHRPTLELINRGHGPESFYDAVRRTLARNLEVVAHLILGLPGESVDQMRQSAIAVADAGVQGVKLHPLYVIAGTRLEAMYRRGEYSPMSEEEALEATLAVLEVLPPEMVIHRLTSDPHPEELVAPLWMLDKRGVGNRIRSAMDARDFRQGADAKSLVRGDPGETLSR